MFKDIKYTTIHQTAHYNQSIQNTTSDLTTHPTLKLIVCPRRPHQTSPLTAEVRKLDLQFGRSYQHWTRQKSDQSLTSLHLWCNIHVFGSELSLKVWIYLAFHEFKCCVYSLLVSIDLCFSLLGVCFCNIMDKSLISFVL